MRSTSVPVTIDNPDIVAWFRGAAPYIKRQRGNIFVIYFSGEVIAEDNGFPGLIADFALLHSLGVKLVLVHGLDRRVARRLDATGTPTKRPLVEHGDTARVTDEAALALVKETAAATRLDIESRLSMEPVNVPAAGAAGGSDTRIRVASGNFVIGRPIGVRGGVDFGHAGEVRRIDAAAIRSLLAGGHVVLISPLGFSPTGEIFSLSAPDVAVSVATSLSVAKLVILDGQDLSAALGDPLPRQIPLSRAEALLAECRRETGEEGEGPCRHLERAARVCRSGVPRAHLLDYRLDGALLLEIYTRDGVGIMVSSDPYDTMRQARIDDIAGIIRLIAPLEEQGILARRSREKLEAEIGRFLVMERDGAIIACAAAYPCVDERDGDTPAGARMLELACLAVHRDYRGAACASALLAAMEETARAGGATHLFVLTTHTEHWFLEHGFSRATLNELPRTRRRMYNESRNAKVLIKVISH